MKEKIHNILISELDGSEWSNSRYGHFNPGEELPLPNEHEVVWAPEPV
jgi:hypothetical protein